MRLLGLALLLFSLSAGAQTRTWAFRAYLDGKAIGYHRFVLHELGQQRELTSEARFEVKLLGFSAYRYAHDAIERWEGDCLKELTARTDERSQLLNAQTGKLEPVRIAALGDGRYRISGIQHPIDLQYSPEGRWIGLESTVGGGRRLSYRLQ